MSAATGPSPPTLTHGNNPSTPPPVQTPGLAISPGGYLAAGSGPVLSPGSRSSPTSPSGYLATGSGPALSPGPRSSPTSPGGLIPEPKEKLNANPDAVYELLGIKWNDRKKMQIFTRGVYDKYQLSSYETSFTRLPERPRQAAAAEIAAEYPEVIAKCEGPWFATWILNRRHKTARNRRVGGDNGGGGGGGATGAPGGGVVEGAGGAGPGGEDDVVMGGAE